MITNKEIQATKLSATKKDFYQIWNELLETASKISDRWDPTATNESDPGIVLLKVLTGIADKLNYTIDKNILEIYMPSAAQAESMRKLCDMMGYAIKYYQSATTDVTISCLFSTTTWGGLDKQLFLPQFSVLTNSNNDIYYITLQSKTFTKEISSLSIPCIQGQLVTCTSENANNAIKMAQLDDNYRYYLPESQIAENGIFITNNINDYENSDWTKVDNLNLYSNGKKIYKFCYDSKLNIPYLQFPDDIGNLIEDGLYIKFIRTEGINGNISAKTLTTLTIPDAWSATSASETLKSLTSEDFNVVNPNATINGRNIETINQAYDGFKKTIGTFNTLVTCRDYMNKIYQLLDEVSGQPLVSNIIVSDIRDDVNKSVTLCSFDQYGISYIDQARTVEVTKKDKKGINYTIDEPLISNFDLVLYPFKTVYSANTKDAYKESFKFSAEKNAEIEAALEENKTISHVFTYPTADDNIICIKNYLKLNAKITTTKKVNDIEAAIILQNIRTNIYNNFYSRNIDFGEEIPYDTILECIENADENIKNVSLEEPYLYTKFLLRDGEEYDIATTAGKAAYNRCALRNILAGRIQLFNYSEDFKPEFNEATYSGFDPTYPETNKILESMESKCEITTTAIPTTGIVLSDNEVISFRAPNYKTTTTYPAYVNFRLVLDSTTKDIKANEEYTLETNEELHINYTNSESEIVNKTYPSGTVIKLNFNYDADYRSNSPKIKPSGQTEEYYNLSASQQIEIRELSKVDLYEGTSQKLYYLYWILNDQTKNTKGSKFFDDGKSTYILQDGEYLFYTDINQLSLVYYGAGTEIRRNNTTWNLEKSKDTTISLAKILEDGIKVIPWESYSFSSSKYISIQEYQYVNLIKDYKLSSITFATGFASPINNNWKEITEAKCYDENGSEVTLPKISGKKLEVRSKLEFNVGPVQIQKLRKTNKIADSIYLNFNSGDPVELTPNDENKPLSIKTNYPIQASTDKVNTTWTVEVGEEETKTITDFKVKVFENKDFGITKNGTLYPINQNNFNTYWTKVNLTGDNFPGTIDFNISLNENQYALIMFCYLASENNKKNAYITVSDGTQTPKPPTIFNNIINNENCWWSGLQDPETPKSGDIVKYYLKGTQNGAINIIKLSKSCKMTFSIKEIKNEAVAFSHFDIINVNNNEGLTDEGLNLDLLDYQAIDTDKTKATQLLSDINKIDPEHNFYYNMPLEQSLVIDLNTSLTGDEKEILSTPKTWYDYNNINNKFVISEIDADTLSSGITIAKSSKL